MNDLKIPAPVREAPEYEEDFIAWAGYQIGLLRERRFDQVDLDNLICELEALVANDRGELRSRLIILVFHLLKCQFQPARKSRSWLLTLAEQRDSIDSLLKKSPSLKPLVEEVAEEAYPRAVRRAAIQTGLPAGSFPSALPYTLAELLDDDFVP